jgi:hypothetical protein
MAPRTQRQRILRIHQNLSIKGTQRQSTTRTQKPTLRIKCPHHDSRQKNVSYRNMSQMGSAHGLNSRTSRMQTHLGPAQKSAGKKKHEHVRNRISPNRIWPGNRPVQTMKASYSRRNHLKNRQRQRRRQRVDQLPKLWQPPKKTIPRSF